LTEKLCLEAYAMDENFSSDENGASEQDNNNLYIIARIGKSNFAFKAESVVEMIKKSAIVRMPLMPDNVAGAVKIRGSAIPVYDMRIILGIITFEKERDDFIATLKQREEDHKNWLNELDKCVRENRKFTLQTDPHKCKFGIWYDTFKTEDYDLSKLLREFDLPHQMIHSLAAQAKEFMRDGNRQAAIELLDGTGKVTLKIMVNLFKSAVEIIGNLDSRIIIIVREDEDMKGLLVDSAGAAVNIEIGAVKTGKTPDGKEHRFIELANGMAEILEP
jgi:chemotaxis signal transduction protein